ncbi:PAS domain-containing hybrid sensor histidine kinase/response regulator [Azospirillum rugosum]|uniref:histidine kinase n=1 Tax=Azospirillum rugosum TaxID=416170 RepID=A0ABS4SRI2_9PROT|nr:PAS domain-containing hybrid sensor histidine kinase/response regulator [Azospirillum rugosum]MBP2295047.1 Na+/proline symporter/CheY-like chemotaxis protein/anti-sigma regulatory factor (Ser/Thr protein kinase) [Azospirillum rugosum]MDQ0528870.1 Na+/proline symporter/CheY-like chemotaxis protein/anti-sigma regulatory factor (Ser/Thr protein kinase) [Azospirillum rugosum]
MTMGGAVLAFSLAYIGILFAIASWGDRKAGDRVARPYGGRASPILYSLSLAVYCSTWTFFGSVGMAASSGYGFLPLYVGPILLFALGWPLLHKVVRAAKAQNITSIADFLAARYGKSQPVATAVTLIALLGTLPHMALQLKAVSTSFTVLLQYPEVVMLAPPPEAPLWRDTALIATVVFTVFAVLFGTRHVEATAHNRGMVMAIAVEAVMKLAAFVGIGVYVTWGLFDGPADLLGLAVAEPGLRHLFGNGIDGGSWITMTLLSGLAVFCLPRMFHVAVIENQDEGDIRLATWLFPAYLITMTLFVVPIAAAGLLLFPAGTVDRDLFVLALPMSGHQEALTIIAFVGGLSAATGMVIVSSVAVSTMVSNDLVVPLLLRRHTGAPERTDMRRLILNVRRATILALMLLSYVYYRMVGNTLPLSQIGLLSLAAVAQFAPPLIGGLIWRGATGAGAFWGLVAGILAWGYTLLLPSFIEVGWLPSYIQETGPLGTGLLLPQRLFGLRLDPFIHGVVWSLLANIAVYVAVSLRTTPRPIESLQARAFIDTDPQWSQAASGLRTGSVTVEELRAVAVRYLGVERAERSFEELASQEPAARGGGEANLRLIRHTERLLASAIGAASARLVMALVLERHSVGKGNALRLLDDATAAIQYNRDVLQTTMDSVAQGIAVFDKDLRLVAWNRRFRTLLGLPPRFGRVGLPLRDILRFGARRGAYGPGREDDLIARQMDGFVASVAGAVEQRRPDGTVLEVHTCPMPGGGYVTTYTDITERVRAAAALAEANEELERRVRKRTAQLARAKAAAEDANRDKTRFLAAASHDLLQPLNAARLYAASLLDRRPEEELAGKLDGALAAVEDLLGELLDISRLDAGAITPDRRSVPLDRLFASLSVEFTPAAERRGLRLRIVPCDLSVDSDGRLLHRMLQNLLANAIRYTPQGRVLLGARRSGGHVIIQVWDTGVGIAPDRQTLVFGEFQRFADAPGVEHGLGLGLSIVQRIGRVLDHPVTLRSTPGRGTLFSVRVPRGHAAPAVADARSAAPSSPALVAERAVVLCIDNDPGILDGMRTLLGGWGCRVRTATGLKEALAALGERPDLILADVHLGDVHLADVHLGDGRGDASTDGIACVAALRRHLRADVPAALITADRSEAVKARALEAGLPVLTKPIRPAALRTLMRRLLLSRRAAE